MAEVWVRPAAAPAEERPVPATPHRPPRATAPAIAMEGEEEEEEEVEEEVVVEPARAAEQQEEGPRAPR